MWKNMILTLALLACATGVVAQDDDGLNIELVAVDAIKALIPVIGVVLVFFVKKGIKKIPRAFLPIIASGLGFGLDYFLAWLTGGTFTPIVGAILGGLSVWLREIIDTIQKHGLQPVDPNGGGL
jgi:hypothetical protein